MTVHNACQMSRTSTSTLYERARAQHLRISWNLLDEWGLAHERTFRMKLAVQRPNTGTVEEFEGCGPSIRVAKRVVSNTALEQSNLLRTIVRKCSVEDPEKQCFVNLLNDVPDPAGPRAEIQQLARALSLPTKYVQVPLPTGSFRHCDHIVGGSSTPCRRIVLHLAGRRFVGEATSRSGAEQEASLAALKALKRAMHSMGTCQKSEQADMTTEDPLKYVQPKNPTWRLKLAAALHFEHPVFKITEVTDSQPLPTCKRTYHCSCTLKSFGTTDAFGPSSSIACKGASTLMLARILALREESGVPDPPIRPKKAEETSKKETMLSKTELKLRCDRAQSTYAKDMHPVTRLEHFCYAKSIGPPSYTLERSKHSSKNTASEFVFKVSAGSECIQGPPACNKRLARRLAAEAMLEHLGFHQPNSPVPPSALRSTPKDGLSNDGRSKILDATESCADDHHSSHSSDHVKFSYAREVLMFHSIEDKTSCKGLQSQSVRSSRMFGFRSQKRGIKLKPDIPDGNSGRPATASDSTTSSSIGHWSDSEEAQTVPRSSMLRRSRSYSGSSASNLLAQSNGHSVSGATADGDSSSIAVNLMLLCQIASLQLEESPDLTDTSDHLLNLCQHLRIPCQFTDHPPENQSPGILHRTTLSIGLMPNPHAAAPPSGFIVVQGAGPSRQIARQQSIIAAIQQLSRLAK